MTTETVEEAAIKYADDLGYIRGSSYHTNCKQAFINGAKSEAAKEYWFQIYRETQCTCGGFPKCICPHLNKEEK